MQTLQAIRLLSVTSHFIVLKYVVNNCVEFWQPFVFHFYQAGEFITPSFGELLTS